MKSLILLLLILITFVLPGCGKKAPPLPPSQFLSSSIDDFSLRIDGDAHGLTWIISKGKAF